jgi:methionyl-tRNA formyltransferase
MARVLFMGTPAYAVPALTVVGQRADDLLVVTRPDAPAGRGRRLRASPVREAATASGWPVMTPERLGPSEWERVRAFQPDVLVTAAYGLILPAAWLALPRRGAFNLHASLLPRWRGANPVAWAIRAGDQETGVSLMRMDAGVDTGPVVAAVRVPIAAHDTTGTLTARLADEAAALLAAWWDPLVAGTAPHRPQSGSASYARRFRPEEARVWFDQDADTVWRLVRSMLPEPGPYTTVGGVRITLLETRPVGRALPVGTVQSEGDAWIIGCRTDSLLVSLIKPAGGRPMTPGAYRRGHPDLALVVEPPKD